MTIPGVIIAGTTSGVGKTTIALAIMYGLLKKGYKVQPFKIGPDYIDPSYHNIITNRISKNLDIWMMGKQGLLRSFVSSTIDSDFTVIEGVMGLFDGLSGKNNYASTAHISRILDIPILLIIDARKAARSLAAIAMGFLKFDKNITISGIIINHVSSERHLKYIKEAFKSKIEVPIVGIIFNNKENKINDRHLGLIPTHELNDTNIKVIIENSKKISEAIEIDKIIKIGNRRKNQKILNEHTLKTIHVTKDKKLKIAIALDKSFNFYYQDNIQILQKYADIEFFSPLIDKTIPLDSSGVIIGGGFPEVIAEKLEKNTFMKKEIIKVVQDGMPLYAECGGLMYLTNSISRYKDKDKKYKMVGLFDADTTMTGKLTLGYTEGKIISNNSYISNISRIRGHEFHYSEITPNNNDIEMVIQLSRGKGITDNKDGFNVYNCIASYMHVHFFNTKLSTKFIKACLKHSKK